MAGYSRRTGTDKYAYPASRSVSDGRTSRRRAPSTDEALALVHKNTERYYEAELYRLKGEFLLLQTIPDEQQAETSFHHALDIARYQQAKSMELRVAMSLSRLWQKQGKHVEARELLTPVYGWFTEGFDTADLQEAKELLAALA